MSDILCAMRAHAPTCTRLGERLDQVEAHLMRLELLRLRVHAVLPDGEDPLDVSVVRLQLSVLSVPSLVESIDEIAVGARGYLACVKFEVIALVGIVLLSGIAVAIAAQGREGWGTIDCSC